MANYVRGDIDGIQIEEWSQRSQHSSYGATTSTATLGVPDTRLSDDGTPASAAPTTECQLGILETARKWIEPPDLVVESFPLTANLFLSQVAISSSRR